MLLAGDHVYKMDYEPMLQQHVDQNADVTIGCLEVPRVEASGFGVMDVDENDVILSFLEKPKNPPAMPGCSDKSLCSMGIYVFEAKFLYEQLRRDADDPQLEPRLRQGHHSLHRPARPRGRASFFALLRAFRQ